MFTTQGGLLAGQAAAASAKPQGLLGFLQNMSPEMKMGLLQAGLGIMANNTGHYGAAGPAIGKGGLIGAQGYNDAVKLKLLKEQQAADEEYRKRKLGIEEGDLDLKRQDANRELSASDALSRALEVTQPQAVPQPVVPGTQMPQQSMQQPVAMPPTTGGMFQRGSEPEIFKYGSQGATNDVTAPSFAGLETNFGVGQQTQQAIPQTAPQTQQPQQQGFIGQATQSVRGGNPSNQYTSEISRLKRVLVDARIAGDTEYEKIVLQEIRNNQLALKEQVDIRKAEFDMSQGRLEPIAGTTGFYRSHDPDGNFTGLVGIGSDGQPYLISTNDIYAKELEKAAASASKTTINLPKEDEAYMVQRSKDEGVITTEMSKAAKTAANNIAALDRFIKNSDSADGGLLQPVFSLAKNFFASFGFDPEGLKSTDDMQSALNSILESKIEQYTARGLTDADMKILKEELPKINTSKDSRVNVARIMQKMYDNEIRVYDERLRQEKEMYPSQKQFIPGWLKKWRTRAIPQNAIDQGFTQPDWDEMTDAEKRIFLND